MMVRGTPGQFVILEAMPTVDDFYELYWNRCPFVVRGAISKDVIDGLIGADELAGLSMEQAPLSRMVKTAGPGRAWSCRFGPFTEQDFKNTGEKDWSLLVQNVEQFHPETAVLLSHFNFAPRWLMDDIMVSYSAVGGSVGPHIDSYHVFLVQGQGKRIWKVADQTMAQETYIGGLDLKVLDGDFVGQDVEVSCGDVLYLPPKFAHQGTTLEASLTFSVGFLGPKLSELFSGYGHYLSMREDLDQRYAGDGIVGDSAGFTLASGVVDDVRGCFAGQLETMDFRRWLVQFFTESGHEDFGHYSEREEMIEASALKGKFEQGASLIKPHYVKFALIQTAPETVCLGFDSHNFIVEQFTLAALKTLMKEQPVNIKSNPEIITHAGALELLLDLYNHQGLEFGPTCT
ncbi:MAG: cupin domain-containing protein [Rhodospirillaceae bacterium]|nr:cupin domain-containing protein [Rhodospirillaceae bacterium]MBT5243033.1 cupin domain-containing protein [Rhodospirillaceae bacterium]MBT5563258.1 cupin domain-containing protein [Rhodospirillaceae bacterium]MBT6243572.1 cupin domain-containing protein [Rhodospirillaceae bacterium]